MYANPKKSQLSDANRRIVDASGPQRRVYQAWKGSNRFFLGGRFIFGPDVRSLVMTVFLIVTPVILFGAFVSPNLVDDFQNVGNLVLAIAVILMTVVIVLLFITSGRDPGIIPRNTHPPEPEEFTDAASLPSEWSMGQSSMPNLPPTKDVVVNGFVVKVKYCHTCMLYRPPRCSHCSICNNCVERFDHHCPWVGQCIGMRNYRFFFMFVSSTMSLCVYVFAFCWVSIKHTMVTHDYHLGKALLKSPITCLLIVYTFIAVWFVGGLTTFHLYLISTNQTTYENFRYRYDGKMNPHNRGVFFNFWEVFFSKVPPSKNNFRAMVKDEPPAFPGSLPMGPVLSQEMAKPSLDLEMGVKRQTVEAEEFADIHSQIETVVSLDGYGPYSSRHKMNSEIAPDRTGLTTLHDIEGDLREHDAI